MTATLGFRPLDGLVAVSLAVGTVAAMGLAQTAQGSEEGSKITRAEMIVNSCFSCHDRTGEGLKSMPALSKLSEDRLISMLKGFKENGAGVTVMGRHASGYSDQDIREIAAYLADVEWTGEVEDE